MRDNCVMIKLPPQCYHHPPSSPAHPAMISSTTAQKLCSPLASIISKFHRCLRAISFIRESGRYWGTTTESLSGGKSVKQFVVKFMIMVGGNITITIMTSVPQGYVVGPLSEQAAVEATHHHHFILFFLGLILGDRHPGGYDRCKQGPQQMMTGQATDESASR